MMKAKGDGGEGLYVRGRSSQRDMEHGTYNAWLKSQGRRSRLRCYICQSKEHLKKDCPISNVMMGMSVEELLDWIMDSGGSYHITYRRDYLVDFEEYDGGNILLGNGRECRVQGTGKVQVQMRDGSSFMLDNIRYVSVLRQNLISLGTLEKEGFTMNMQSDKSKVIKGSLEVLSGTRRANCVYTLDGHVVTKKTLKGRKRLGEYHTSEVAKHLGVAGIQQQNGLVEEINMTLFAKVLQGVEFEVEPQEDHTFKVETHGNVDHSDVYVLSNDYRKCIDDRDGYYWEYTPAKGNVLGIEILRDHSGNTLRGGLSGDYDVEKNGKWSCIYTVGSQEYQVVCTRLDIASTDVGILDKFDRGLQTNVQVFVDFDYTMRRSITVMGRSITSGVNDIYGGCKGGYLDKWTLDRVKS
ncbi:zinc finger, CCHC-type containing protein [Tanacetum coccineum]